MDVKQELLNVGEETAVQVVNILEKLAASKLNGTSNELVKSLGLMALPFIKSEVLKLVDQIDGEDDAEY